MPILQSVPRVINRGENRTSKKYITCMLCLFLRYMSVVALINRIIPVESIALYLGRWRIFLMFTSPRCEWMDASRLFSAQHLCINRSRVSSPIFDGQTETEKVLKCSRRVLKILSVENFNIFIFARNNWILLSMRWFSRSTMHAADEIKIYKLVQYLYFWNGNGQVT